MLKTLGTHNYILTNRLKTVLYTGVTNDLKNRIRSHKENINLNTKAFSTKYRCFYLVYYEHFNSIDLANVREKQIKGWVRIKKDILINEFNPNCNFLNDSI